MASLKPSHLKETLVKVNPAEKEEVESHHEHFTVYRDEQVAWRYIMAHRTPYCVISGFGREES